MPGNQARGFLIAGDVKKGHLNHVRHIETPSCSVLSFQSPKLLIVSHVESYLGKKLLKSPFEKAHQARLNIDVELLIKDILLCKDHYCAVEPESGILPRPRS
jgi:hypothetical protein